MGALTKKQLLSVKFVLKEIEMPELGGSIYLRPITLAEQTQLGINSSQVERDDYDQQMKKVTLPLIQWSVVDFEGNPFFDSETLEILAGYKKGSIEIDGESIEIKPWPSSTFLNLQNEIIRNSGLAETARKELEKNLLVSPSVSPALH